MPTHFSRRRFLAAAGALAAGTAGCSEPSSSADRNVGADGGSDGGGGNTSGGSGTSGSDDPGVYTQVYRDTIDSVVSIQVQTPEGGSQGSGWVYDDRHVVTNQHVVEGATQVRVRFSDDDWRSPTIQGTDVYSDLAVLTVDDRPSYARPLSFVQTPAPIGERVVALGNPFGLNASVSAGIVSGVDRSLPAANNFTIPDAIQTDAAVNPGNSGGPLVDLDRRVIGVINSGGGDNIGFAISAALCKRVIPALVEDGRYRHTYMGVSILNVSSTIAQANGLDKPTGVYVVQTVDGGPSAGVLRGADRFTGANEQIPVGGDVIRAIDDRRTPTTNELGTYLALNTRPGDTIDVTVLRDGQLVTEQVTLDKRPRPTGTGAIREPAAADSGVDEPTVR